MVQSISPPFTPHYPWLQGEPLFANELNAAIANAGHGGGFRVTDWLPGGQPDGTSDNTLWFQLAINAAAGNGRLTVPANTAAYIVGTLNIPSNTHLFIEAGATLKLAPNTNNHMLLLANNATGILIELYGTLDGNASAQPGTATPPLNSGGIVSAGFVSNAFVVGDISGLITNFCWSPIDFQRATNCEVSGVSMTNCAIMRGGSAGIAGNIQRPNATSPSGADKPHIVSGTYTGATGLVSLTTNISHGIVPGQEISPIALFGTGGVGNAGVPGNASSTDTDNISNTTGTGSIFVALPGTAGTTVVYQANPGGADAVIAIPSAPPTTAGWFDLWATPVATIATGTYTATNPSGYAHVGTVSLTTPAPHGIVPGQLVLANVTAGTGSAVTSASGAFFACAGTSGSILNYEVPLGGTSGNITAGTISLSTKSYGCGFVDCYLDNINDIALALYGGCENSYIRNCEVTRSNVGISIFSDRNSGRSVNCEIADCYAHDVDSNGIQVSVASAASLHLNCRVFNNYVTGCGRGIACDSVDGMEIDENYLYANKSALVTPGSFAVGEISVSSSCDRVKVSGNTIRNAGGGGPGHAAVPITSGTYDTTTGNVSLVRTSGANLFPGCIVTFDSVTGSGAFASLQGIWTCTAGTNGTSTVNFTGPAGLGAITITGGRVWSSVFGILLYQPPECYVIGNYIGDYQTTPTMAAALGGKWGPRGYSSGNYYGPQFFTGGNFPADQSQYQLNSQQGPSFDTMTGFTSSTTPAQPVAASVPPIGLTVGFNRSGLRAETNLYVGASGSNPGGFDFWKVISVHAASGTYNVTTGAVSLTLNIAPAPAIAVGQYFSLQGVLGYGAAGPPPVNSGGVASLNGNWQATAGTAGTTLNFTGPTGLDIVTITGGGINTSPSDGGLVDTSVGISGLLLANDGYGNTKLGGALVHGAAQAQTLANAGTLTINPNTSMVLVQNSASIAAGTVVLPTPPALGFTYNNAELEINFQNPVGTLTVTAGGTLTVSGAPTSIAAAGTSINFLQHGTAWLRRIMA